MIKRSSKKLHNSIGPNIPKTAKEIEVKHEHCNYQMEQYLEQEKNILPLERRISSFEEDNFKVYIQKELLNITHLNVSREPCCNGCYQIFQNK